MNIPSVKFWQFLAFISGSIIAGVMALASISYNATLGTLEPAFPLLPITNRALFASLALAFDLGMVASVFGFWHWSKRRGVSEASDREPKMRNRVAAAICVLLFIVASLFSIHSVRGYITTNITKSLAPAERNKDVYASLKQELLQAQNHLAALRTSLLRSRGRRRARRQREIARQVTLVHKVRARLASAQPSASVTPLAGLEWFLALTLWFFNATCWTAWFGHGGRGASTGAPAGKGGDRADLLALTNIKPDPHDYDSVRGWLDQYHQSEPEHCAILYQRYCAWCRQNHHRPLKERNFYTLLGELGTRKFRDGRNGPTLYELPHHPGARDEEEVEL